MGTYRKFQQDSRLEQNGIELNLGEVGRFTIARAGGSNQNFAKAFKRLTQPYRRAIASGSLDDKTSQEILIAAHVEATILGWEGVTDESGNPLPFSKENAKKLFTDLPELFEEIRRASEDAANFRAFVMEESAGNSEPSSPTS